MKKIFVFEKYLAILFFTLVSFSLFGQTPQLTNITTNSITIGGGDELVIVKIVNTTSNPIDSGKVQINLPNGLSYASLVSNYNFTISSGPNIVFKHGVIPVNDSAKVVFKIRAACLAFSWVDNNNTSVNNEYLYTYSQGNSTQTLQQFSNSYNIVYRNVNVLHGTYLPQLFNTINSVNDTINILVPGTQNSFNRFGIKVNLPTSIELLSLASIKVTTNGITTTITPTSSNVPQLISSTQAEFTFDATLLGVGNFTSDATIQAVFTYKARNCFSGLTQIVTYSGYSPMQDGSNCTRSIRQVGFNYNSNVFTTTPIQSFSISKDLNACGGMSHVINTITVPSTSPQPFFDIQYVIANGMLAGQINIQNLKINGVNVPFPALPSSAQFITIPTSILSNIGGQAFSDLPAGATLTVEFDYGLNNNPFSENICGDNNYGGGLFDHLRTYFFATTNECDLRQRFFENLPYTYSQMTNAPTLTGPIDIDPGTTVNYNFCFQRNIVRNTPYPNGTLFEDSIKFTTQIELPCSLTFIHPNQIFLTPVGTGLSPNSPIQMDIVSTNTNAGITTYYLVANKFVDIINSGSAFI